MKPMQTVLFACLAMSFGCGTQPTVPVSNETADSSVSPSISSTGRLANRIIPVSEEQSADPSLKLLPSNDHAINLIRTWVTMQGVQFDESALGYCDEFATTVVFRRPESKHYIIDYTRTQSGNYVVQAFLSDTDKIKPNDVATAKRTFTDLANIAALVAYAPKVTPEATEACADVAEFLKSSGCQNLVDAAFKQQEVDSAFEFEAIELRFVNAPVAHPRVECKRK